MELFADTILGRIVHNSIRIETGGKTLERIFYLIYLKLINIIGSALCGTYI